MPPPAPPKPRNKRGGQRKSAKIENTPDAQDAEDGAYLCITPFHIAVSLVSLPLPPLGPVRAIRTHLPIISPAHTIM